MNGPRWALHSAHTTLVRHGTRYWLSTDNVSCAKATSYLRNIFKRNPNWAIAGLKGGPPGYRCSARDGDGPNRHAYMGGCIGNGPNPMQPWVDHPYFDWNPYFTT
jgi:hypothetical protein